MVEVSRQVVEIGKGVVFTLEIFFVADRKNEVNMLIYNLINNSTKKKVEKKSLQTFCTYKKKVVPFASLFEKQSN